MKERHEGKRKAAKQAIKETESRRKKRMEELWKMLLSRASERGWID